jgi:hypothetical protein
VGCIVEGVPIDELNSIGPDSSFTIEQDGSGTRFSAVLQGVEELTAGAEDLPLPGIDFDELFSIVFTATGPGSLGDNNATSTDGSTATWAITADASFVEGGDATMTAEWTPGGGSDNSWLIPLLVVVGLVLIGLIAFLLLRRKGQSPEPAEHTAGVSAVPPPPPGAVDTPPAPHPPTNAPPVASSPPPPPAPAPTAPPVSAPPPPPASSPPPPPPPPAEPPPPPPPTA